MGTSQSTEASLLQLLLTARRHSVHFLDTMTVPRKSWNFGGFFEKLKISPNYLLQDLSFPSPPLLPPPLPPSIFPSAPLHPLLRPLPSPYLLRPSAHPARPFPSHSSAPYSSWNFGLPAPIGGSQGPQTPQKQQSEAEWGKKKYLETDI